MELADPFYKNIKLDPKQSTITADFTIENINISLIIGYDTQLNICIKINNTSELTKKSKTNVRHTALH